MKKYIFRLLDIVRGIRGKYCTYWLKKQFVQYGDYVGAARVPHISRMAKVKVGPHASFNGFTVSGGVNIGSYFHSGTNVTIMLGSHDYDYGDKIPYGSHYATKYVVIDDFVWLGSNVIISENVHIGEGAIVAIGKHSN